MRSTPRSFAPYALVFAACSGAAPNQPAMSAQLPGAQSGFAEDLAFLREHTQVVLLHDTSGRAQVIVAPEFQGRVMTSSTSAEGPSFGFVNRSAVASKTRAPHINVFGGEDRFWVGPEGGPYGLYFAPGDPMDFGHWQTPEPIDWGAWEVSRSSPSEARFRRAMQLTNYAGTHFDARVERTVRVLDDSSITPALGFKPAAGLEWVGYSSENTLCNQGDTTWTKERGLLSVWILGMFNPSPQATIVIPFKSGPEGELGPIVNDAYFGKIPAERLVIGDGVVFFRGDGQQRGKIGLSRKRALPIVGAYDARGRVLTLVRYTLPEDAVDYVNSMWEAQQAQPYAGDVVNSYNDGPPEPGKPPLGPFFELETSSRAAALAQGQSLTHVHTTVHLMGPRAALDQLAQQALGVGLDRIEGAFGAQPTTR
jgi:hypothetical protein